MPEQVRHDEFSIHIYIIPQYLPEIHINDNYTRDVAMFVLKSGGSGEAKSNFLPLEGED